MACIVPTGVSSRLGRPFHGNADGVRRLLAIASCLLLLPAAAVAAPGDLPEGCSMGATGDARVVVEPDRPDVPLDSTVAITPPRIEIARALAPGDAITCIVTIRSRLARTATFELAPRGILGARSSATGVRFVEAGDDDANATAVGWIAPASERVRMAPRSVARVPVVVTVPEDAPVGGVYAALDVVSRTADVDAGDTSLGIETVRQVSMLLHVGGEGTPKLRVRDVRAPQLRQDRDPWTLRADLTNDGTLHAVAGGRVRIRSLFGSTVASLPVPAATVLPHGRVDVETTWDRVPWFGIYRYDLRVAGRSGDPARAEGWFVALPPTWMLAAAGVLVLAALVLLVRGRRRASHADHDEWLDDED